MSKENAKYVNCTEDEGEHNYRDYCWNCAPFWYKIPTCPACEVKLNKSGFCRQCRKYFALHNHIKEAV